MWKDGSGGGGDRRLGEKGEGEEGAWRESESPLFCTGKTKEGKDM